LPTKVGLTARIIHEHQDQLTGGITCRSHLKKTITLYDVLFDVGINGLGFGKHVAGGVLLKCRVDGEEDRDDEVRDQQDTPGDDEFRRKKSIGYQVDEIDQPKNRNGAQRPCDPVLGKQHDDCPTSDAIQHTQQQQLDEETAHSRKQ